MLNCCVANSDSKETALFSEAARTGSEDAVRLDTKNELKDQQPPAPDPFVPSAPKSNPPSEASLSSATNGYPNGGGYTNGGNVKGTENTVPGIAKSAEVVEQKAPDPEQAKPPEAPVVQGSGYGHIAAAEKAAAIRRGSSGYGHIAAAQAAVAPAAKPEQKEQTLPTQKEPTQEAPKLEPAPKEEAPKLEPTPKREVPKLEPAAPSPAPAAPPKQQRAFREDPRVIGFAKTASAGMPCELLPPFEPSGPYAAQLSEGAKAWASHGRKPRLGKFFLDAEFKQVTIEAESEKVLSFAFPRVRSMSSFEEAAASGGAAAEKIVQMILQSTRESQSTGKGEYRDRVVILTYGAENGSANGSTSSPACCCLLFPDAATRENFQACLKLIAQDAGLGGTSN